MRKRSQQHSHFYSEREAGKLKQGVGSWKSRRRAHGLSTNNKVRYPYFMLGVGTSERGALNDDNNQCELFQLLQGLLCILLKSHRHPIHISIPF